MAWCRGRLASVAVGVVLGGFAGAAPVPLSPEETVRHYLQELPADARRQGCDAIFCPTSLGPLRGRVPSFITLFDLTPRTLANRRGLATTGIR